MPPSTEPDDAALERLVLRFVGAVIAIVLAAGVLAAAVRLGDDDEDDEAQVAGDVTRANDGPAAGQEVASYVEARTAALEELSGRRAAVVSFRSYVTAADVATAFDRMTVTAYLVVAEGGSPSAILPNRVAAWVDEERAAADAEVKELEKVLPTTEDPAFEQSYREAIARLRALVARIDPSGPVVFGAVVVGDATRLRMLARRQDVRLVDAATSTRAPKLDGVRGLRPEETVTVGEPRYRPVAR